ncbi:photosynthetic complex assembly protein PuhC [Falsiroseomonas sp.]|uniref:photosynthetic complex assembly protein PuhC n=1 Tax=Falsiroseomonas sp. TaxID=2870721 RepID=UPI00271DEDF4|nr:photosynthetic complex assembly protein PuhC [Falsiroseomonas sp.]MDO9503534.1 photosynthetic complex assembly protein PuhC [Falsiroseomonas sp.]MDP3416219.1 photosynthetic complex assembly protein PuhC [Falsiroseomonas sp.]
MSQTIETNPILRRPALVCGSMIAGVLALVLASPFLPSARDGVVPVALAQRDLFFSDRGDGGVVVSDSRDGRQVAVLEPGEGGFVRGTVRGLVRERKREDIGSAIPFRLTAWQTGQITLEDQATGRKLDLTGFGQTNAGAFVRFLSNRE